MAAGKTSLAAQLERLKLPQTSVHRETHGAASFLYDFFEAKSIDAETHYSVAVAGLESLETTVNDPAVGAFRETLFSESSKSLDRGVLSQERNAAIDALLEEYLFRVVSRYFQHADTHRTIEWLLYRYRANEYNTEALIGCVLPYHETRHFVRLLQTVSAVKNPRNSLWSWLKPIQESGVPLTKSVLLGYCTRPTGLEFIRFITDSVFKGMAVDGGSVTWPSFLTSFCVNLLELTSAGLKTNANSGKSSEQTVILMVVSVISKAMRSSKSAPQLFTASYLIFAHLCTVTRLQTEVVESFLGSLLKRLKRSVHYEGVLMALTIVVHSQELRKLPAKYLNDELVANLAAVMITPNSNNNPQTNVSFEPLLRCLLLTLIDESVAKLQQTSETAEEAASSPTANSSTLERYKAYCDQLLQSQRHLTRGTVFALVNAVNGAIEEHQQQQNGSTDDLFAHLLQSLKTAAPIWFEQAIDSLASTGEGGNGNAPLLRHHQSLLSSRMLVEALTGELMVGGTNSENLEPGVKGRALDLLSEKLRRLKPHEMTAEQAVKVLQALATAHIVVKGKRMARLDEPSLHNLQLTVNAMRCTAKFLTRTENNEPLETLSNVVLARLAQMVNACGHAIKKMSGDEENSTDVLELQRKKTGALQKLKSSTVFTLVELLLTMDIVDQQEQLATVLKLLLGNFDDDSSFENVTTTLKALRQLITKFAPLLNSLPLVKAVVLKLLLLPTTKELQQEELQAIWWLLSSEVPKEVLLEVLDLAFDGAIKEVSSSSVREQPFQPVVQLLTLLKLALESDEQEFETSTMTSYLKAFLLKVLRFREEQAKMSSVSTSGLALPWHLVNREEEGELHLSGFQYQLYYLLLRYANPSAPKKVAKVCRGLLSSLVESVGAENSSNFSAFAFFLPIIANSSEEFSTTRASTLSLLTELLNSSNTSTLLIASLQAHPQYLIAFLGALASPALEVRQLALETVRTIGECLNSSNSSKSDHLKTFTKTILEKAEEVVASSGAAGQIITSSSTLNGLLVQHLTELLIDQAWTGKLSRPLRVSLLHLLASMGDVESKRAVFKFYYGRFFEDSREKGVKMKARITGPEDEKELMALLTLLNIEQEGLFVKNYEDQEEMDDEEEVAGGDRQNYVCAFYLAAIELPAQQGLPFPLSRETLFGLYHFMVKGTFDRLRTLNPPFALQLILGLLRVQLTLSEISAATSTTDITALIGALKSRLKRLNTDGDLITAVLQHLLPVEKVRDAFGYASKKNLEGEPSLPEKRLRSNSGGVPADNKFTSAWKLLRIYMSTFQSKGSIENAGALMRTLFDYLRLTFMELGDNSAEYTRQTLLYTVANCVEAKLGDKKSKQKSKDPKDLEAMEVDEVEEGDRVLPPELAAFNVDIIVDCMRESRVRETQKLALLLLGQVAPYFRRPILDYLVEIFTFIGTSLLQCDDQYSLQILFDTLESVVPIVLEGKKTDKKKSITAESSKKVKGKRGGMKKVLEEVASEEPEDVDEDKDMSAYVVSIFVKAFPDVPSYRRLQLFSKLICLLGERHYLPVVSVRLLEEAVLVKSSSNRSSNSSRAEREVVQSFLLALLGTFPPSTQLEALCTLLALFDRKFFDHHLKRKGKGKAEQSTLVSSPSKKSAKGVVLEEFSAASEAVCAAFTSRIAFDSDKAACGVEVLRLVVNVIGSGPFVAECRAGGLSDSPLLIHMLNQLLEMIVSLGEGSGTLMKSTMVAYRRRIKTTLDDALLKYHRLLSSRRLIEIVTEELLVQKGSSEGPDADLVWRKALELLNEKLLKMAVEEMAPELALAVLRSLGGHLITEQKKISKLNELALHNLQLTVAAVKFATRFICGSSQEGGSKRKLQQITDVDDDQHRQQRNEVLAALITKVGQMAAAIEVSDKMEIKAEDQQNQNRSSRSKSLQNLKGSCLLTLTQLLVSMSLDGLGHLATVVDLVLANLKEVLGSKTDHHHIFHMDDVILLSNVCALNKLLGPGGFAAFLSQAHLRSILLCLLEAATVAEQVNGLRAKLAAGWSLLARLVPKRGLFEAIDAVYEETVTGLGPQAVVELMALFKLACDNLQRVDVELMVKSFKGFMIKALEYRSKVMLSQSDQEEEVDLATIETIETAFGEAFSAYIPKLNEATFRPIFYRLLEWALSIEGAKKKQHKKTGETGVYLADVHYHRMIAFYRFTSLLADRLKSLFCVFVAPSVVGNAAEMLNAYHSDHFAEEKFGSSQKMGVDNFMAVEERSTKKSSDEQLKLRDPRLGEPLVGAILSTLSKCFLYDLNGAFVNKDVTSMIVKPIVNQISNLFGTPADFEARLGLILQCTQYLIQNNKDEALIKEFNYQILLKTREGNEKVRVGAIKVLHRLILTCSEDYLPFIPEAIPFIAELSEYDAEAVEGAVKRLIVDIEQLVGEPINKYL